ncbi:unnamed protein product [Brassica oleracea]
MASRFFTNQKSSLHILEHFIRICSYINFSQPREQETLEFHCNTIERMVWSGPNAFGLVQMLYQTYFDYSCSTPLTVI